jgi:hypothetical protein
LLASGTIAKIQKTEAGDISMEYKKGHIYIPQLGLYIIKNMFTLGLGT